MEALHDFVTTFPAWSVLIAIAVSKVVFFCINQSVMNANQAPRVFGKLVIDIVLMTLFLLHWPFSTALSSLWILVSIITVHCFVNTTIGRQRIRMNKEMFLVRSYFTKKGPWFYFAGDLFAYTALLVALWWQ